MSTTVTALSRPQPGENAPYYDRYISLVPGDDVLAALDEQRRQTLLLLSGRSEADGDFRYAPDKWSLKEMCIRDRLWSGQAPEKTGVPSRAGPSWHGSCFTFSS